MTIAFMGGEMSAFLPSDSTPTEITSGGIYVFPYDGAFSRCGMRVAGISYVDTPQFAALTECWTHISLTHRAGIGGSYYPMIWLNASDVPYVRMKHVVGGETVGFERWTGAAWTAVGSDVSIPLAAAMQVLDVRILCNTASGNISLYVAGTERFNVSVDLSALVSVRKVRVSGDVAGLDSETRFSQVVVRDSSTIGCRLGTCVPSGAGATSAMTGAFTDIDETVYSDADFIFSGTANQVSTFAQTPIPAFTGYRPIAVAVSTRVKRGSGGPQKMRHVLRSAGVDTPSSADITVGLGYTPTQTIWETNPGTSADFLGNQIAALQPGAKSIA